MRFGWLYKLGILGVIAVSAAACGDSGSTGEEETDKTPENTDALCSDGIDNDGDSAVDCDDAECTDLAVCQDTEVPADWATTWVASQQLTESNNLPADDPGLPGNSLRQVIQITLGGTAARFTFSNEYGKDPVAIVGASAALSTDKSGIDTDTLKTLTFDGESSVTIPAGKTVTTDSVEWTLEPLTNLAVTIQFGDEIPTRVTGHPGSRTTSYIAEGDMLSEERFPVEALHPAETPEHWYFLASTDVMTTPGALAVVTLGDSITDGRGSDTNKNNRWPNILSKRILENADTANIAVLNQGVGGNCLTRDCLGPAAKTRFERDVLDIPGVRWVIILEGINDLNNGVAAQTIIDTLADLAGKARDAGISAIGGTILPCMKSTYCSESMNERRKEINAWIRTTDLFDAVVDFDEITRDPDNPDNLLSDYDSEDGLHPSPAGHAAMGEGVPLSLFELPADTSARSGT